MKTIGKTAFIAAVLATMVMTSTALGLITLDQMHSTGSSTVHPVTEYQAKDPFKTFLDTYTHPDLTGDPWPITTFTALSTGTGVGYSSIASGTTDIGAGSSTPKSTEWSAAGAEDMRIWTIGMDSVCIIVNLNNPVFQQAGVLGLTRQEAFRLFCRTAIGEAAWYTEWDNFAEAELGIPDGVIADGLVINKFIRVLHSGTHDAFKKFFIAPEGTDSNDWLDAACQQKNTNDLLLEAVEGDTYAVGYIGLGFVGGPGGPKVPDLDMDNGGPLGYVTPSKANVLSGAYAPYRLLWYITREVPAKAKYTTATPDPAIETALFISFVRAHPEYLTNEGYICIYRSDMTSAVASGDNTAPIHPSLPEGKYGTGGASPVNFWDIIYFVNAYNDYDLNALLNPYADLANAGGSLPDGVINFWDIIAFVNGYNDADLGVPPC